MKPYLSVEKLTQRFPDGTGGELTVFENASFRVEKGEFVVILGHSGCGKSTIMNILAGLGAPTSGVVKMDGEHVSGPRSTAVSSSRTIRSYPGSQRSRTSPSG